MPKKLTDLFVKKVRPGTQRVEYRDGHTRGLVLRVTPHGAKTWAVLYRRKSDARKRRYTIGAYPAFSLEDARNRAQEVVAAVARREDPAGELQARNAALTFAQLAGGWVGRHAQPNKTARALYDDKLMLERDIYPAIGAIKADEVPKRAVIKILDEVNGVADEGDGERREWHSCHLLVLPPCASLGPHGIGWRSSRPPPWSSPRSRRSAGP